jgi:excisionase family DNA binding protein
MADTWITTAEASALTGYTQKHISRLLESGAVKGRRFGRVWMVHRGSLLAYVKKQEMAGAKRGPKP